MRKLTKAQRRLLSDLANGGIVVAAIVEPHTHEETGVVFSERVGINVWSGDEPRRHLYRIRNKTLDPLYPDLVNHNPDVSGLRQLSITEAGRAALQPKGESHDQ